MRRKLTPEERKAYNCKSKRQFDSPHAAEAAGNICMEKFGMAKFAPYKCECCNHWHLKSITGIRNDKNKEIQQ